MPALPPEAQRFLQPCSVIDFEHPAVTTVAAKLRKSCTENPTVTRLAELSFNFVRDEISHSGDIRSDTMTCSASQVLEAGTGWCFAKSHLLAALLRANGIPAALCYQRLSGDAPDTFTLHGLNSVWLPDHGWYRCDARGNKPGVNAQFTPPLEQLAWPMGAPGEIDFPARYSVPIQQVVNYLRQTCSFLEACSSLPDEVDLP